MKTSEIENIKLVTSNENKLREFRRFGIENIEIEKGIDLPEVNSDPITVVKHKANDAGPNRLIEDTNFDVENMDVGVNIRWLISSLKSDKSIIGRNAVWTVYLGFNDGSNIYVYKGEIKGKISESSGEGFGFDPIFTPNESKYTLAELEKMNKKDDFSARLNAVKNFMNNNYIEKIKINNIEPWSGEYQH